MFVIFNGFNSTALDILQRRPGRKTVRRVCQLCLSRKGIKLKKPLPPAKPTSVWTVNVSKCGEIAVQLFGLRNKTKVKVKHAVKKLYQDKA